MESDREFGINLMLASKVYDTGCTAKVRAIIKEYDDGKMDITVMGFRRYNLASYTVGNRLYYEADVEYYEDESNSGSDPDTIDLGLLDECIRYYNEISDIVKIISIRKIEMSSIDTRIPSFLIAQKSGMSLKQKQELLEMRSENKRLLTLKNHLREILPMLRKAENINQVIRNDGFIIQ
jgi:Lon protease-like protein